MSRIRYLEFRPGHWVKLIDGKVVEPATVEEVTAWKREHSEQARIWEDVVGQTASDERRPSTGAAGAGEPGQEPMDATGPVASAETQAPERPAAIGQVDHAQTKLLSAEPVALSGQRPSPAAVLPEPTERPESVLAMPASLSLKPTKPVPDAATDAELVPLELQQRARPERAQPSCVPSAEVVPLGEVVGTQPESEVAAATPKEVLEAEPEPGAASPGSPQERAEPEWQPEQEATAFEQIAKPEPEVEALGAESGPDAGQSSAEATAEASPERWRPSVPSAHRRSAKGQAAPSPLEQTPGQVYLWFMVAPSDDLVASVQTGLSRYEERFHQQAEVVLCHAQDVAILEEAGLPVDVRQGKGVPARNFWIGPK